MGIMVSKDLEQKSELNRRITSDLRARNQAAEHLHNESEDSEHEGDTKKTSKFTWIWIILIVLAIISLFCILFI